jgi:hypothetical protein
LDVFSRTIWPWMYAVAGMCPSFGFGGHQPMVKPYTP